MKKGRQEVNPDKVKAVDDLTKLIFLHNIDCHSCESRNPEKHPFNG